MRGSMLQGFGVWFKGFRIDCFWDLFGFLDFLNGLHVTGIKGFRLWGLRISGQGLLGNLRFRTFIYAARLWDFS